jgi:hypothetical protein
MERDFGMVSWPCFIEFVNLRFGLPIRTNSVAKIKALVCTGTVEEYSRRFLTSYVELQYPVNLQQAMRLVQAYEQR